MPGKKILVVSIFAVAMALLETSVVIYLRELLYPGGFDFPLVLVPQSIAITELLRELATLLMLVTIGILAGRKFSEGFAWFLYSFAVWDIFYYIFLKLLIGWPDSVFTWDILFLIPTTWTGPVISPLIVSATMIWLALIILFYSEKGKDTTIKTREWFIWISGSLILVLGFIMDYSGYMLDQFSIWEMFSLKNADVMEEAVKYIPSDFPWIVFIIAECIIAGGIWLYHKRIVRS